MVGGFKELLEREQARSELHHLGLALHVSSIDDSVSNLQMSQVDLQALLASTQNVERETRRDLSTASEEIASLKASHAREVEELERQVQRKDREKRGLEEELKESRDEISRERQVVRDLKVGAISGPVILYVELILAASHGRTIHPTHDPLRPAHRFSNPTVHPPSRSRKGHPKYIEYESRARARTPESSGCGR